MDAVDQFLRMPRAEDREPVVEGKKKTVLFANNNPGTVRNELFASFVRLSQFDLTEEGGGHIGGFMTHQSGACISIFRNQVVEIFLNETNLGWLWFVDSDIDLKPDTLKRMMEVADPETHPIVAANYFMYVGNRNICPSPFYRKKFPDGTVKMAPIWNINDDWPRDTLVKCDGAGMGCTLIHRSVLEAMKAKYGFPEPWFAQENIGGVVHGEDLTFFHRAGEMGYPVYVHTGIEVGHAKTLILTSDNLAITR